jgi:hypothetical protein
MLAIRSRFLVAAACAAVATGFVAGPAGASAGHVRNATDASGGRSTPGLKTSTNFGAGYFSYPGTGNVASASVTFKTPTFSCAKTTDDEWLSPGVWIYNSSGVLSQFSGVEFNCNDGATFTGDVICLDSYATCDDSMTVSPGDRVVASLSESSTATIAAVHDLTSGTHVSISAAATTTDETVFVGDEGPMLASSGAVTRVPTFTKVLFSKAQVNGQYLGDWSPVRYNLATHGTKVQESAGVLTGDCDAFSTTFKNN